MPLFGGGGNEGQIRYPLILDDQATQKLNAYKAALTSLNTATRQSTNVTKQFGLGGLGPLASNYKNASGAAKDMIVQTQTLGSRIKEGITVFKDHALAIGATASSVIGLVENYTNLQRAQLLANRSSVMLETCTKISTIL